MSAQKVSASTTVAAPAAVVFALVADPHQHPRLDGSGSVQNIVEGPGRLTRGDTFHVSMKMFGMPYRIANRVVEYDEDRLIAWRHFGGHRWRYELEPLADGGTRVTETFDYSRYGLFWRKALEVAGFPRRNRRGIEATLERLKSAAEHDAAAPSDVLE